MGAFDQLKNKSSGLTINKRPMFERTYKSETGKIVDTDDLATLQLKIGTYAINDLAYSGSMYVAMTQTGLFSSPDLITWTNRTPSGFLGDDGMAYSSYGNRLAYGNGIFMFIGAWTDYSSYNAVRVWTSTNGITWSFLADKGNVDAFPATALSSWYFHNISFCNGFFYFSSNDSYFYRTDGSTITVSSGITPAYSPYAKVLSIGNYLFLESGNGYTLGAKYSAWVIRPIYYYSTNNGVSWSAFPFVGGYQNYQVGLSCISYINGYYYGVNMAYPGSLPQWYKFTDLSVPITNVVQDINPFIFTTGYQSGYIYLSTIKCFIFENKFFFSNINSSYPVDVLDNWYMSDGMQITKVSNLFIKGFLNSILSTTISEYNSSGVSTGIRSGGMMKLFSTPTDTYIMNIIYTTMYQSSRSVFKIKTPNEYYYV